MAGDAPLKNWLITGGCGFIGSNLIKHLRTSEGNRIRIIDNMTVGDLGALAPLEVVKSNGDWEDWGGATGPISVVEGDVRDRPLMIDVAKGADVIVHLAANTGVLPSVKDPHSDCTINVVGTLNALDGARLNGVGNFVLASSSAALGDQTPPIHEKLLARPISPYGASKLAGEAYCNVYANTFGVHTAALRFGNVYGPGSVKKGSVVPLFIKQALNGETLTVYGDGTQTRDFIYIDDLVEAIVAAASLDVGGEVFQIATHKETTVNEIADHLVSILKRRVGVSPSLVHAQARPSEVRRSFSDISKARTMLGWAPRHDVEAGLDKTVAYFCELQSDERSL